MTEPAPALERRDLPRLTSLRWFAALVVFLLHLGAEVGWAPLKLFVTGGAGVMFFFVLSGFVLTWSARPGLPVRRFYLHRLARIWPSATVMLLVAVLVSRAVPSTPLSTGWSAFLADLLLVQAWLTDERLAFSYNDVAWSLSVELVFYLLFPLVLPALRAVRGATQVLLVLLGLGAQAAALVLLGRAELFTVAYANPLVHLPVFVAGVVLALRLRAGWRPRVGPVGATVVLLGCAAVSRQVRDFGLWQFLLLPAFLLLIAAAATADRDGARGWLGHPWLVYLGRISFSFYLTHWLALRIIVHAAGWDRQWSLVAGLAPAAVTFTASLLGAVLLHHLVERPAQRVLVRRVGKDRRSTPPAQGRPVPGSPGTAVS